MGIVKTQKGEIQFDGENIIRKPVHERVKRGIGYVPQGRDIFPKEEICPAVSSSLQIVRSCFML